MCWGKDIDTSLFLSISYSLPELITLEPKSCLFKRIGPISPLVLLSVPLALAGFPLSICLRDVFLKAHIIY